MKFWDSSALVPLILVEDESQRSYEYLDADPEVVLWHYAATEILSAVHRRVRNAALSSQQAVAARDAVTALVDAATEILPTVRLRSRAHRLLASHPLRAADALQLAAALMAVDEQPEGRGFVCYDTRLGQAAQLEGFTVLD